MHIYPQHCDPAAASIPAGAALECRGHCMDGLLSAAPQHCISPFLLCHSITLPHVTLPSYNKHGGSLQLRCFYFMPQEALEYFAPPVPGRHIPNPSHHPHGPGPDPAPLHPRLTLFSSKTLKTKVANLVGSPKGKNCL